MELSDIVCIVASVIAAAILVNITPSSDAFLTSVKFLVLCFIFYIFFRPFGNLD